MCRVSWNLGASTSWKPQGLSRPVMGLIYLYFYLYILKGTWRQSVLLKRWRISAMFHDTTSQKTYRPTREPHLSYVTYCISHLWLSLLTQTTVQSQWKQNFLRISKGSWIDLWYATACFSCSPPDLNFLDPYFIFMYMHYNHCHRATTHLQLNILLLLLLLLFVIFP